MRFVHEGMSLWYGTEDTPVPPSTVKQGNIIEIVIAVQPADASNEVQLLYRINNGAIEKPIPAKFLRKDPSAKIQYFIASFPKDIIERLHNGDLIEYSAVCYCAGLQVPGPGDDKKFGLSFTIVRTDAEAEAKAGLKGHSLREPVAGISSGQGASKSSVVKTIKSLEPKSSLSGINTIRVKKTRGVNNVSFDQNIDKPFVVRGQVNDPDGRPVSGMLVVAIDKDLRGEETLGTAISDKEGKYEITYTAKQFSRAEKDAADLIVRVVQDTTPSEIVSSPIIFNAGNEETVDLSLPSTYAGINEYDRLVIELEPLLVNVTIPGMTEPTTIDQLADLKKDDIDFLIGEIGQERTRLEFLIAAAILEKNALLHDLNISAAVFYGLARQGLPIDLHLLFASTTAQKRKDALVAAIKNDIIPWWLNNALEDIIIQLEQLIATNALQNPPATVTNSLGNLLNITLPSIDTQMTLLSLSDAYQDNSDEFWKKVREHPKFQEPGLVEKIQLTLQLGLLTQNHIPLIQELYHMDNLNSIRDLVKMDKSAWLNIINKQVNGSIIGVPEGTPGSTQQEKAMIYADSVVKILQVAFPTATITQIVANIPNFPFQNEVSKFFANSLNDFDIGRSHVDTYVVEHASTAFNGISEADRPKVVEQVKTLQRVFQLSTNAETMSALLSLDLHSAHAIANMPLQSFLDKYTISLGGKEQAMMIHERSKFINARVLQLYRYLNDSINGVQSTAWGDQAAQIKNDLVKRMPNYTELFGSLDLCDCKDCRSTLSPAAYLVDLFEFLRNLTNSKGKTLLDVLLKRRPDLEYLPLSCENTNTPMPYLDLVNEILESYIALGFKLDDTTMHDTGNITSDELDANPQYTDFNPNGAYYKLASAETVFPFTLPFNLPIVMMRVYLENLGSSRYEIMNAFQKNHNTSATKNGITAEYLKLTQEEYQIITNTDFEGNPALLSLKLWNFYGYDNDPITIQSWKYWLKGVPEFLRQTGISYDDLVQLIQTYILNPGYPQGDALRFFQKIPLSFTALTRLVQSNFANPLPEDLSALEKADIKLEDLIAWCNTNYQKVAKLIVLDALDSTCNLEKIQLQHLDGTLLDDVELDKLHRFIRLWRKIGRWSIADLDTVLAALSATDITSNVLTKIAQIKQLQDVLNISDLQTLLSLWTTINTRGDQSLYKRLFLNNAAVKPDPAFLENIDGSVLTNPAEKISDHIPALVAALRISAGDIALVRKDADLDSEEASLNLINVSSLYRYAALAKMLQLRVGELVILEVLSGINPFIPPSPDQTVQFETIARSVKESGFKVAQLNYLYRHITAPPSNLAPQQTTLLFLAKTLRDGLIKIVLDNTIAPDPNGNLTHSKLTAVFDNVIVDEMISMVNSNKVYSAPLSQLPDVIAKKDSTTNQVIGIDPTKVSSMVARKVSYDPKAALLRFQGTMTTVEKNALMDALTAASSGSDYQTSVNNLYQQPVTFIQNSFSPKDGTGVTHGFLDGDEAAKKLILDIPTLDQDLNPVFLDAKNNPLLPDANASPPVDPTKIVSTAAAYKFSYILERLLPYLITQLSHALVKQTIANELQLDADMAQLLLEFLCKSTNPKIPDKYAIEDFLDIKTLGLTGSYFSSDDLSGIPTVTRVDSTIGFDGTATKPEITIPAGTNSVYWAGFMVVPNTGEFIFSVYADGNVRLWIGNHDEDDDDAAAVITLSPPDAVTHERVSISPVTLNVGQFYRLRLKVTQISHPTLPNTSAKIELRLQSGTIPKSLFSCENLYPSIQFDIFGATFTRIQKSAMLINRFNLTTKELAYISKHSADFSDFDLNSFPLARYDCTPPEVRDDCALQIDQKSVHLFRAWMRLNDLVVLRDSLPNGEKTLIEVFGSSSLDEATSLLAQVSGWDPKVIANLVGTDGFNLAESDLKNEIWIAKLKNCVQLIKIIGASASQLFAWADIGSDFQQLQNIAQQIKKIVQSKYDEATWLTVAKQLSDVLRDSQRSALIAYLISRMQGITNSNQLFEYFLIDAEMSPCMKTSRVKQAISSIQLFVQRCLMNLEERKDDEDWSVSPSAIDADQWKQWMMPYVTWRANREIFHYPENWCEPELRDDKTPFFKELESELRQNDITAETAETAFLNYLEKLDQVARLEICGMCWQDTDPDTNELINILHVFGRTPHEPHMYYYRHLLNNGEWTPWETVKADIKGDHVIPVIWNRRLFVFWPTFTQKTEEPKTNVPIDISKNQINVNFVEKYWQIGLEWSEYKQNKWSPKITSNQFIKVAKDKYDDFTHSYFFRLDKNNEDLLIHCEKRSTYPENGTKPYGDAEILGTFELGGCIGNTVNINTIIRNAPLPVTPPGADFDAMMFAEFFMQGALHKLAMVDEEWAQPTEFLENTPSRYRLLYPHQFSPYLLQSPFFYQDDKRTFFVKPVQEIKVRPPVPTKYVQSVINSVFMSHNDTSSTHLLTVSPLSGGSSSAILDTSQATKGWAEVALGSQYNWHYNNNKVMRGILPPIHWHDLTTYLNFDNFYHPFTCEFLKALTRNGIPELVTESNQSLGIPYLHNPWNLATWSQGSVTTISENATGPACIIQSYSNTDPKWKFEAVVREGTNLVYYWRDNSNLSQPWQRGQVITSSATGPGWLIQGPEFIVQEGNNLVYYSGFGRPGQVITNNATGPGCLIAGFFLRRDVVVLENSDLVHYYYDIFTGGGFPAWQRGRIITSAATSSGCIIISHFKDGNGGFYFEVVVCEGSDLVHYRWDGNLNSSWQRGQVITSNASGAGCIIQSSIRNGRDGNFEVIVPEGNSLVHYWLDNSNQNSHWKQAQVISGKVKAPPPSSPATSWPAGCIIQSDFGRAGSFYGNFEVLALEGNRLVHYWNWNNNLFQFGRDEEYKPTLNVKDPYPVEEIDFRYKGAYSVYNWELFYHVPLLIAKRLRTNGRFSDAIKWCHYMFNPTDDTKNEPIPSRYWKVLPFKSNPRERIQDMMIALDKGDQNLNDQIDDWRHHPFQPHRLARLHPIAYQKNLFMTYIEILLEAGDMYYRQYTIESINIAEQYYIMVSNLLGPIGEIVKNRGIAAPKSYYDLRKNGHLDEFSNAMVQLENEFPYSGGTSQDPNSESGGLLGMSSTLYFCIPKNDNLLSYWNIVSDRLFKIRHCMDITGVVRQLPLFEPPIDPALLVQAAAQGVDISSVLNDLNSPLPNYRFSYTLNKALELCSECKSLGAALLSALEKKDAEEISLLRATHETNILNMMETIKQKQNDEANAQVESLKSSREVAKTRYTYYQKLLGVENPSVPDNTLANPIQLAAIPTQPPQGEDGATNLLMEEKMELDSSHSARDWQVRASTIEVLASVLAMLPNVELATKPIGIGFSIHWGMQQLWSGLTAWSRYMQNLSAQDTYEATHASKMASYFRRNQEWSLQNNLAAGEIMQIDKQIAAANIRVDITKQELSVHQQQMKDAQDVQDFLNNKYTNQDLYDWMISEISATYFQCYQLAYDLAKKAERTYRFELGLTNSNFIQFGYWDSLRKGLQAGERLYLSLKQMDQAYHNQNKREYEITKNISLLLLDPLALIRLKTTGRCEIELPEALFDSDYPGHYMRRIKSVSLTIPCVVGPYTSINCTMTLLKNKTRLNTLISDQYMENIEEGDERFITNFTTIESIAISHGQDDRGMFELNFHDERYLPFEYAGAISRWRIDMPIDCNAFDFNTISDVIIKLNYTAREGGDILREKARLAVIVPPQENLTRFFSLKHEFPNEWFRFMQPTDQTATSQTLQLDLKQERFPFQLRGKKITIDDVVFFLKLKDGFGYADDKPLVLRVGTDQLNFKINSSPVRQLPFAKPSDGSSIVPNDVDTTWLLEVKEDDLKHANLGRPSATSWWQIVPLNSVDHVRLNPKAIDDIWVLCQYSAANVGMSH